MLHALLIGINEYQGSVSPLSGCVADAQAIRGLLLKYPDVTPPQLTMLLNADATKNGIIAALEQLAKTTKQNDTILVYYSGHGALETAEPAIWQTETLNGLVCYDSGAVGGTLLSDKELRYLLQKIALKAAQFVVITDCCHSGSITRLELRPRLVTTPFAARRYSDFIFSTEIHAQANLETQLPQPSHLHLAACEDDKLAYESSSGGQLTQVMLAILARENGDVTYLELITELRAILTMRGQTPALSVYGAATTYQNSCFLGENELNDPNKVLLKYISGKGWVLLSGASQGIFAEGAKNELQLTVFEGKTPLSLNLIIEKVTQTETKIVQQGLESLNSNTVYRVFVSGGYPALRVFLRASDPFSAQQLQTEYKNREKIGQLKAFCIEVVPNEAESDYVVMTEKMKQGGTAMRILATKSQHPAIAADAGSFDELWSDLKAVQLYRKALNFRNPMTKWAVSPIEITYNNIEKEGAETPILFQNNNNFIEIADKTRLRIRLKNNLSQPIYVAGLSLSSLFGIDTSLQVTEKLAQKEAICLVQQGEILFTVADWIREFGLKNEVTHHLFIVATQPIETARWQQAPLPPPQPPTKNLQLMRGTQGRSQQAQNTDDWTTVLVQIAVKA